MGHRRIVLRCIRAFFFLCASRVPPRAYRRNLTFHLIDRRCLVPDASLRDLLARSAISFVGTVQALGAATMNDVKIDEATAVVRVERVLHAPEVLSRLAGQLVTVQLQADEPALNVGDRLAFFANASSFGESVE